jgi:hypothetical protein
MFRDESDRIIRKARKLHEEFQAEQPRSSVMQDAGSTVSTIPAISSPLPSTSIPYALSQPINEIGAHFFFANYTCDEPPLSESYHAWLTQMYYGDPPNHALRAAIEAAGMAGISTIFYAPNVESKSKERYGRALAAVKQTLSDPVELVADTTLMTVILLGLFEVTTSVLGLFLRVPDSSVYSSSLSRIGITIARGPLMSKAPRPYYSFEAKNNSTANVEDSSSRNFSLR